MPINAFLRLAERLGVGQGALTEAINPGAWCPVQQVAGMGLANHSRGIGTALTDRDVSNLLDFPVSDKKWPFDHLLSIYEQTNSQLLYIRQCLDDNIYGSAD